jgi:hypothetical protein
MRGVAVLSTGLAATAAEAGAISSMDKKNSGVAGVEVTDGTVTHGTKRYYGTDCVQVADGKGAKNHGLYLKWIRQHKPEMLKAAKASNCGKPVSASKKGGDEHK